jgi:hypothetical protein
VIDCHRLCGSVRNTALPLFRLGAGTCGVDKKDEESPSGGVSNPVAIVLALGVLGVLGLLALVVMGLIFLFQTAL